MTRYPFVLVVLLSGCMVANSTMLRDPRPPIPVDDVIVYATEAEVSGSFVTMALLKPLKFTGLETGEVVVRSLVDSAAQMGANGVILRKPVRAIYVEPDTLLILNKVDDLDP